MPDSSRSRTMLRGEALFHRLREISRSGQTGTLEFRRGETKASVRFLQGRMLYPSAEALSAFLVREGKLTQQTVRQAAEGQNPGEGLMEVLIRKGSLTEESARKAALNYLNLLLRAVAYWPDGHQEFREADPEDPNPHSWGGCSIPERIFSMVRTLEDTAPLFPQLEDPAAKLSLVPSMEQNISGLDLRSTEGYLLSRITEENTVAEILSLSPLSGEETRKILCGFVACGVLLVTGGSVRIPDRTTPTGRQAGKRTGTRTPWRRTGKAGARKRRPLPTKRPPSVRPPAPSPSVVHPDAPGNEPAELMSRFKELPQQNLYQVLGVSTTANLEEIRMNYYELARKFHPDRFRSTGEENLSGKAETLLAHITEAYRTLGDPSTRSEYDQNLLEKSQPRDERARVDNTRLARENDQRGLQLLRSGQLQKALQFFQNAVSLDPSQDTYLCHLAQVKMRNPRLRSEARENLERAISINPSRAENYLQMGLLLQREGKFEEAAERFRETLSWDPNDNQAQQLLREILSGKTDPSRLSRLFRK